MDNLEQTREVDYETHGKKNIQEMLKPAPSITKVNSAALLNQYDTFLSLAGSKLSDVTRDHYEKALVQFRTWTATVPHVDERVTARLTNTDASIAEFRREMETAFCMAFVMCIVALVISVVTLTAVLYIVSLQRTVVQVPTIAPLSPPPPSPPASPIIEEQQPQPEPAKTPEPAATTTSPEPPKYPLLGQGTPFATACDPIYPNATSDELGYELSDVRYSLRYALLYGNLRISAVNAIHIGFPHCYTMINTNYSANQPRYHVGDDSIIEMFNLRLAGYTPENRTRVRERHIECDRSEWFVRFKNIWVQYEDASGRTVERRFDGPMAVELQHMLELHFGHFRCNERQREEMSREIAFALARVTRDTRPYQARHVEWTLPPAIEISPPADSSNETPRLPDR